MRPMLFGAVLALLWLTVGPHLTVPVVVVNAVAQAVTATVVLVVLARPYLSRGRRTR
ncbi:hypothetical protein ACH4S8_25000 [Streptomyces sp. NPDC021080]|uniref:hypothetical protein n=1 Tax=Streptomyces sp. NPDC021080 TaxID=3365110 RepID=UPI0037B07737